MPKTLNEWKTKVGKYNEIEINALDYAEKAFVGAISNAINGSQIELNEKLTKASAAVSYLKFASALDPDQRAEEKLQTSLIDIVGLADHLKDKKNMKTFAKTVNADKTAPLFGPDGLLLVSIFNIANNNFGTEIDSKSIKELYNECKQELIKENDKELEKEQNKNDMIPLVKLLEGKNVQTIKEENEFEKVVEENASPDEMNIIIAQEEAKYDINNMSLDNNLNLDDIEKGNEKEAKAEREKQAEATKSQRETARNQAMDENSAVKENLYAKHNNDGFFRIGGASKELRELRSAHSTYDTFMHNPDDPKFAKHSEFGILKDILTKAEKYRAEKKLHGKGDTSSPNWKPKTRMGQLRYAAAAKSIEFAKDRMRTLVSDYAKDKNITLQKAYKHFDPNGELKLYNFNKNINLDDKIKETQQTLNSLKERFDKGEKVALVDVKSAISDLSAVYLIKLTNKTKEVKHSVFEERAEYLFRSAAMTKVMNENKLNDLFEQALNDKGQNIWAKVNQARTELKNEKKSKEDSKYTKIKENSKTTTTTVTSKTTVNGITHKK